MTPEEYAAFKVIPFLGISPDEYYWYSNLNGMSYGFFGLALTVRAMAKFGQLHLQGGLYKEDSRVIDQNWIERSTTMQTQISEQHGYGYMWWVFSPTDSLSSPLYCALGMGEQAICVNEEKDRVIAISSDNYIPPFAGGISDESLGKIVEMVMNVSFSEPSKT